MAFSPERRRKTEINLEVLKEIDFAMAGLENLKAGGGLLVYNQVEPELAIIAINQLFFLQRILNFTDNVSFPNNDILFDIRQGKLVCLSLENKKYFGDLGYRVSRHGYDVTPMGIWKTDDQVIHLHLGKPFAVFARQAIGATIMAEGVANLLPQYNKSHESQ